MHTSITIATFIVLAYAAAKSFRGKSDWGEYSSGARDDQTISPYYAAVSIFASFTGGFMLFGVPQLGIEGGISGYIIGLSYVIGLPMVIWIVNRISSSGVNLRKGYFGVDILVKTVFGPSSQLALYVLCIVVFIGVLGAQLLAIGYYLNTYTDQLDYFVVLLVGVAATFFYTCRGGLKAVLANDNVQGLFEFATCLILLGGVWLFVSEKASSVSFTVVTNGIGGKYGAMFPFVAAISVGLTFIARPDLWQRIRLVAPEKRNKCLWGVAIAIFLFYASMATIGVIVKSNPDVFAILQSVPLGEIPIKLVDITLHPAFQVLALSGMLLGLMSSIDAYLNIVAVLLAKVVLWREQKTDENVLIANARIASLGSMVLATMLAVLFPDIVDLLSASFSVFGVLVPIVAVAIIKQSKAYPDWVGAIPLWLSLGVLIIAFLFLRAVSFIPAIFIGWVSLLVTLYVHHRITKITH
jgi:Na+/proline symporter